MRYARVENDKVMEIIDFSPQGRYHPSIEEQFIECDETVEQGYEYKNGNFKKPKKVVPEPQPIVKTKTEKLIDKLIEKGILAEGEVE